MADKLIDKYEKTCRRIGRTVCTSYFRFGSNPGYMGIGILTSVAIIDGRIRCFINGKVSPKSASRIWDLPKSEVIKSGWYGVWDVRLSSSGCFRVNHYLKCLKIFQLTTKYKISHPYLLSKIDWRKEGF